MGFRNPITTAVDTVARAAASQAQTTAAAANATAAAAQAAADNSLQVASARNHIFVQSNQPVTSTLDDLWINPANGNQVKSWDGSAWQPAVYGTQAIAAGAITTDLLAAGAVAAGKIAADAIDGKTITGAIFQSAASGQRVVLRQSSTIGQLLMYAGLSGENPASLKTVVDSSSPATRKIVTLNGGTDGTGTQSAVLSFYVQDAPAGGQQSVASLDADVFYLNNALLDDTGWQDITIASTFAGNGVPQVRRYLGNLHFRNGFAASKSGAALAVNTSYVVGTLPSGFWPPWNVHDDAVSTNPANEGKWVLSSVDGSITLLTGAQVPSTTGYFRLDSFRPVPAT
jgi:hypothetical protein